MANTIRGMHYYEYQGGDDQLMVAWKNGIVYRSVVGNNWKSAPGVALDTEYYRDVRFETFIDRVFITATFSDLQSWDGTVASNTSCVGAPRAEYIKAYQGRLYLYNIRFDDNVFSDRVWYSDVPENNIITWGLEYGDDLVQTADSAIVTSTTAQFLARNIKIGDPFTIVDGPNAGVYAVSSVTDGKTIVLTSQLDNTVASSNYWVGGNWFDVNVGDGDVGRGMGIAANELFLFKANTVWRWNATATELRQVKNVVGTSSPESIVSHNDYIYWSHRSGIFRSNGFTGEDISTPIEDIISGMGTVTSTVAWVNDEDKTINFKVNDASVPPNYVPTYDNLALSYPVLSFETEGEIWTIKNLGLEILFSTKGYYADEEYIYVADDNNTVYQVDTGNVFQDVNLVQNNIPFEIETYPIYPAGSDSLIDFNRIRLYVMGKCEVTFLYKLYYKTTGTSKDWVIDSDWKPLTGSQDGERSEWHFPVNSRASGVQLKITENSKYDTFTIEKIVLYYSNPSNY